MQHLVKIIDLDIPTPLTQNFLTYALPPSDMLQHTFHYQFNIDILNDE